MYINSTLIKDKSKSEEIVLTVSSKIIPAVAAVHVLLRPGGLAL